MTRLAKVLLGVANHLDEIEARLDSQNPEALEDIETMIADIEEAVNEAEESLDREADEDDE